ncbi:lysophospholipid acyltransferase family protein [Rathayibacter soli]|uniref:lysophospholipid acyltransferase family protein n=1 Tax=Rathayibacter soli TaxID=3144168 RepID=UPI0027E53284|nr:lysophospholipid acyltransferase family protein [Glaciibacter superstes]
MSATKPDPAKPRPVKREPVYASAIAIGRLYFGGVLALKPMVAGRENLPDYGGAVLAITHFGYLDFALTEWVIWKQNRRRIRFLAQKGAFDKPVIGWLLRGMRHISVDMQAGKAAYAEAVDALRSGELLGIFPEAGVSASFTVRDLKSGAIRMAAEAGVPVVPIAIWGGQLLRTKNHKSRLREARRAPIGVSIGKPITVQSTDDVGSATVQLRHTLQSLLDGLQRRYPRGGAGQWWQPAHLGGTAPTPEVAAVAEAKRQARKTALREGRDPGAPPE